MSQTTGEVEGINIQIQPIYGLTPFMTLCVCVSRADRGRKMGRVGGGGGGGGSGPSPPPMGGG